MISNSIKNYISSNIGNNNRDLELSYIIYILLAKKLFYSPLFVKNKKIEELPTVDEITLDNPYVNCQTWSELYNELLHEYNIDSHIDGKFHKLVEFTADNIPVRADATLYMPEEIYDVASDLTNIKFGLDALYFRPKNSRNRDEFLDRIYDTNERLRIPKGKDNVIIGKIRIIRSHGLEDRINKGIELYNEFYDLSKGEVERRQIFERYYKLLFDDIGTEVIDFYDQGIMSKHLLEFIDGSYCIENDNGFRNISFEEIEDLISSEDITIKYDHVKEKLLKRKQAS